ncbi:MAG: hypothetical protein ABSH06_19020 [Thermodesulfobacteriota bacterium]|jgi:hypothetical protein
MGRYDLPIISSADRADDEWRGNFVREETILGDYTRFYRVKWGYCGHCKKKIQRGKGGAYQPCECGSTIVSDGTAIAPDD